MTDSALSKGENIRIIIRLFGLVVAATSSWMMYSQWMSLNTDGTYSMRYVVLAPLAAVMGIFLFLFPKFVGKPETTPEKVIVMLAFVIGVAAGLYNLYLMDPSKFGL